MRTVRSAARARNQPRGGALLIVLAVLAALAVLVARAGAAPAGDDATRDDDLPPVDDFDPPSWSQLREDEWPGGGPCPCEGDAIERIAAGAPRVSAVVAAAVHAAGLAGDPTPGWRRRSRWSALVPWLSARVGNSESWREVADPTISHAVAFDVRAAWRLEKLIFDPAEPRITAHDVQRRRERRSLSAQASRAYFAWLRARVAAEGDPRWTLREVEAIAELDALTAGWFSERLGKPPQPQ